MCLLIGTNYTVELLYMAILFQQKSERLHYNFPLELDSKT